MLVCSWEKQHDIVLVGQFGILYMQNYYTIPLCIVALKPCSTSSAQLTGWLMYTETERLHGVQRNMTYSNSDNANYLDSEREPLHEQAKSTCSSAVYTGKVLQCCFWIRTELSYAAIHEGYNYCHKMHASGEHNYYNNIIIAIHTRSIWRVSSKYSGIKPWGRRRTTRAATNAHTTCKRQNHAS